MRMCHFRAQNGPFVPNNFFLVQTIINTFTYLFALCNIQNLKKFLQQIQSFEGAPFLAQNGPFPQMRIFSEHLLMSLVPFIYAYLQAKNQSQILYLLLSH